MPSVIISVSHRKQFVLPRKNTGTLPRKDELIAELRNLMSALASGALNADALSVSIGTSSAPATRAAGLLQFSSGTGAVGATINGVAVTVTWATSDTASMTAFCAAVRASSNALVKGLVSAVNRRLALTARRRHRRRAVLAVRRHLHRGQRHAERPSCGVPVRHQLRRRGDHRHEHRGDDQRGARHRRALPRRRSAAPACTSS
jgi:hypothetical protein